SVDSRRYLRDAHTDRAEALLKLGRPADAVKDWDRAIALDKGPDRPRLRLWRNLCLARAGTGDYAKAVAEAVALPAAEAVKGLTLYDAGRVCTLGCACVKKDAAVADQYAARAVGLLAKARTVGYFKDATRVERLKKDDDLTPLRGRDDFKKLLREAGGTVR